MNFKTRFQRLAATLSLLLLSACGGGGDDGKLRVTLGWDLAGIDLFESVHIPARTSGFEDHSPRCSVTSGRLPAGMAIQNDCTLVGRPAEAGSFMVNLEVSATDVSNSLPWSMGFQVRGPVVSYFSSSGPTGVSVGVPVSDAPSLGGWQAPADAPATWTYALLSGTLPPGLALDASTGVISGTPTADGSFSARIQARLSTPFGSFSPLAGIYSFTVKLAGFRYLSDGRSGGTSVGVESIYVSQPFVADAVKDESLKATSLRDFRLEGGSLPPGLSLDTSTGRISGTPTAPAVRQQALVLAVGTFGAIDSIVHGSLIAEVAYPLTVEFPTGSAAIVRQGFASTLRPILRLASSLPLTSPSYAYTVGACTFPPGLSMNAATGVVSGTPTAAGSYACPVDVTITHNGVSWSQVAQLQVVVQ